MSFLGNVALDFPPLWLKIAGSGRWKKRARKLEAR
jgi:hypothetical protein